MTINKLASLVVSLSFFGVLSLAMASQPESAEMDKWTKAFQSAETMFYSRTQYSCVPLFQNLISRMMEVRTDRDLTDSEILLLGKSLDYLAQAFFNNAEFDRARHVLLNLIELDPDYQMDEDLVSPRITELFSQVKQENLGRLSITSEPKNAAVRMDGRIVGITDIKVVYGIKGNHQLEISKSGYVTLEKNVIITPGTTQQVEVQLAEENMKEVPPNEGAAGPANDTKYFVRNFPVYHDHSWGSCSGLINITSQTFEYNSEDSPNDSFTVPTADILEVKVRNKPSVSFWSVKTKDQYHFGQFKFKIKSVGEKEFSVDSRSEYDDLLTQLRQIFKIK
jgi:hypothetical protein